MTDLSDRLGLERLGLSQYLDSLISEGFDSWETLSDITESDLNYLNVKLGHRRKLQRAIAEWRGQPSDKALPTEFRKVPSVGSDESGAEHRDQTIRASSSHGISTGPSGLSGTKRKYRRHPKPDSNAPERPPSAYVIFSNQVREELKGQDLTFTEIAKVVGERWQVLPADIREACEQQANSTKEKYYAELSEYKRTPEYSQYQEYLQYFKTKHGPSRTAEGKRSKLEPESSSIALQSTSIIENVDRSLNIKSTLSLVSPIPRSSGSSPPSAGAFPTHSGFRRASSSASPTLYSKAVNSPVKSDPYSPDANSPALSNSFAAKDSRQAGRTGSGDHRGAGYSGSSQYTSGQAFQSPGYRSGQGESWKESKTNHNNYIGALPRRTSRGSPSIPSLVHEESTLSSDSTSSVQLPPSMTPLADMGKPVRRTLPQPLNFAIGAPGTSFLNLRQSQEVGPASSRTSLPPISAPTSLVDPQRSSNWPALLRATELAREAAMKGTDVLVEHEESP